MTQEEAEQAFKELLYELPLWLTDEELLSETYTPAILEVKTRKNVRRVGRSLIKLQEYFGLEDA